MIKLWYKIPSLDHVWRIKFKFNSVQSLHDTFKEVKVSPKQLNRLVRMIYFKYRSTIDGIWLVNVLHTLSCMTSYLKAAWKVYKRMHYLSFLLFYRYRSTSKGIKFKDKKDKLNAVFQWCNDHNVWIKRLFITNASKWSSLGRVWIIWKAMGRFDWSYKRLSILHTTLSYNL